MLLGANAPAAAAEKIIHDRLAAGRRQGRALSRRPERLVRCRGPEVTIQSGRGSSDVVTKLGTGSATWAPAALRRCSRRPRRPRCRSRRDVDLHAAAGCDLHHRRLGSSSQGLGRQEVATATFSSSNVAWPLVLQANGIDPAKVNLLKADPARLRRCWPGKVAATINWITVAPAFEKPLSETSKKLKVIQWSDYGLTAMACQSSHRKRC